MDQTTVAEGAVLLGEGHQSPLAQARAGRRASVSSMRASSPGRLWVLGHARMHVSATPDRLVGEVGAASGGVALVEEEVEDMEHPSRRLARVS